MAVNPFRYVKNVGKSFGYSAIDSLKNSNPQVAALASGAKDLSSDLYESIKDFKGNMRNASKDEKGLFALGKSTVKDFRDNLFEDLKTGNWYNKERISEAETALAKDMGFDFDDFDMDFNFDDEDLFDEDASAVRSSTTAQTQSAEAIVNSMNMVGSRSVEAISNATVRSADYIVEANNQSSKALYSLQQRGFMQMSNGLAAIDSKLTAMVSMAQPLTQHMQNSATFYTKSTEYQNQVLEKLDIIIKNTTIEPPKNSSSRKTTLSDLMTSEGTLDLGRYFDFVKGNFKNAKDNSMITMMLDMFGGSLNGLSKQATASPMKLLTDGLTNVLIPQMMQESMKEFNKALGNFFPAAIDKIQKTDFGANGGVFGSLFEMVKDMFIPADTLKKSIKTGNYNHGQTVWTGESEMALKEVIPTYLSAITAALTGNPMTQYDYSRGAFVTRDNVKNLYNSRMQRAANSAGGDFRNDTRRAINSLNMDQKTKDALLQEVDNFFLHSFEKGSASATQIKNSDFNYSEYGIGQETLKLLREVLKMYEDNNTRGRAMEFASNVRTGRDRYNAEIERAESENGVERSVFDNSSILAGGKGSASGRLLGVDQYGHDIFYYLQGIWKSNWYLADNIGLFGSSAGGGGKAKGGTTIFKKPKYRKARSIKTRNDVDQQENTSNLFSGESVAEINQETMEQFAQSIKDSITGDQTKKSVGEKTTKEANAAKEENINLSYLGLNPDEEDTGPSSSAKRAAKNVQDKVGNVSGGFKAAFRKIQDRVSEIFATPAKIFSDVLNAGQTSLYNMIFGKEGEDEKGLFGYFFEKADNLFIQFNQYFSQQLKDTFHKFSDWIVNGSLDELREDIVNNLKGAGRWIGNRVGGALGFGKRSKPGEGETAPEPINNGTAAYGRRVTKTGVVAVSEGELIIPSEYNPFYHGSNNKSRQMRNERNALQRYYGSFAEGGTVGGDKNNVIFDLPKTFSESLGKLGSGLMQLFKSFVPDNPEEEEENVHKLISLHTASELKKAGISDEIAANKGAVGAGAIAGTGISLLTGAVVGPLAGAAIGASVGLVIKSEKVQHALFGDVDENGDRTGNILSKEVSNLITKKIPNTALAAGAGGIAGLFMGSPIMGAVIGGTIGFAAQSDKVRAALFGTEDSDSGLISKEMQSKLKAAMPNMGAGAIAGLLLGGPFGIVGNVLVGSAVGYASTSEQFQDMVLGKKDKDGNRVGGIVGEFRGYFFGFEDEKGKRRQGIFESITGIFNKVGEEIKVGARDLFKDTTKRLRELVDRAAKSTLGQWLGGTRVGRAVSAAGRGIRGLINAPFSLAQRGLEAIDVGLGKHAISKGHNMRNAQGNYMTAQEQNAWAEEHGVQTEGQSWYAVNNMLSGMTEEQLEGLDEDLANLEDPTRGYDKQQSRQTREFANTLSRLHIDDKTAKKLEDEVVKKNSRKSIDELLAGANITPEQRQTITEQYNGIRQTIQGRVEAQDKANKTMETLRAAGINVKKPRDIRALRDRANAEKQGRFGASMETKEALTTEEESLEVQKAIADDTDRIVQLLLGTDKEGNKLTEEAKRNIAFGTGKYQPTQKKCPHCGEMIDAKASRCPHCGCEFDSENPEVEKGKKKCPDCGTVIDKDEYVCPNCGHIWDEYYEERDKEQPQQKPLEKIRNKASETVNKIKNAIVPEGKKRCLNCGAVVDKDEYVCPECGHIWDEYYEERDKEYSSGSSKNAAKEAVDEAEVPGSTKSTQETAEAESGNTAENAVNNATAAPNKKLSLGQRARRFVEKHLGVKAVHVCPECGTKFDYDQDVCPNCGFSFKAANPAKEAVDNAEPAPKVKKKKCPQCGYELDEDDYVCPMCGYTFAEYYGDQNSNTAKEAVENQSATETAEKVSYTTDMFGNTILQTTNEQGEPVPNMQDKESRQNVEDNQKVKEGFMALAGAGAGATGLSGLFGKLTDALFGSNEGEEKQEGLFSKLFDKFLGDNSFLGGIFNLISGLFGGPTASVLGKSLSGAISKVIGVVGGAGLIAAVVAGLSGKFDDIMAKLTGNRIANHETKLVKDAEGVERRVQLNENGDIITNDEGQYLLEDGTYVDAWIQDTGSNNSLSSQLKENLVTGTVLGTGSVVASGINEGIKMMTKGSVDILGSVGDVGVINTILSGVASALECIPSIMSHVPFLKKFADKADTIVTGLYNTIADWVQTKAQSKVVQKMGSIVSTATTFLKPAIAIGAAINGYGEAEMYFEVKQATVGQKIVAAFIAAINALIPIVGNLIPNKVIIEFFVSIADKIGLDMSGLEEQQRELQEELDEYNRENGTDLTTEEYQETVLHQGGIVRKVKNFGKSVVDNIKEKGVFGAAGEAAKSIGNGIKNTASKAWNGVKNFFGFGNNDNLNEVLSDQQLEELQAEADAYNQEMGTNLTLEEYLEIVNENAEGISGIINNGTNAFGNLFTKKGLASVSSGELIVSAKDNPIYQLLSGKIVSDESDISEENSKGITGLLGKALTTVKDKILSPFDESNIRETLASKGLEEEQIDITIDQINKIKGTPQTVATKIKDIITDNIDENGNLDVGSIVKDTAGSVKENGIVGSIKSFLGFDDKNDEKELKEEDESLQDEAENYNDQINDLKEYAKKGDINKILKAEYRPKDEEDGTMTGLFRGMYSIQKLYYTAFGMIANPLGVVGDTSSGGGSSTNSSSSSSSEAETAADVVEESSGGFISKLRKIFSGKGSGLKTTYSGGGSGTNDNFVSQVDGKYKSTKLGESTVGEIGCAPAVGTMLVNTSRPGSMTMRRAINDAKKYQTVGGTDSAYFADLLESNGMSADYYSGADKDTPAYIKSQLEIGRPTVLLGRDPKNRSKDKSPFGPNQHYVMATGLDNHGNIIVNDPEARRGGSVYKPDILENVSLGISSDPNPEFEDNYISGVGGDSFSVPNNANSQAVWNYFIGRGFSPAATAGIMGNIYQESAFDPTVKQNGGKGPAAGLFQWESWSGNSGRWKQMKDYATSIGKDWTDLGTQLKFGDNEFTGELSDVKSETYRAGNVKKRYGSIQGFKDLTDYKEATKGFEELFEEAGDPQMQTRYNAAKSYYDLYKDGGATATVGSTGTTAVADPYFIKYTLTDTEIKQLANLATQEQGSTKGAAAEASIMANLWERDQKNSKYKSLYDYVRNSGWFNKAATYMDNGPATGVTSDATIDAVKRVLNEGKRTIPGYVDEHDCFSDFDEATNNGVPLNPINDRSQYQKDVTKLHNVNGSSWTFWGFPDTASDPFGYTAANRRRSGVEEGYYNLDGSVAYNANGPVSTSSESSESESSSKGISGILNTIISAFASGFAKIIGGDDSEESSDTASSSSSSGTSYSNMGGEGNDQQKELVNVLTPYIGKLKYDRNGPRNPEKGSADCSSTVNWAYQKVLGQSIGNDTGSMLNSTKTSWVDWPNPGIAKKNPTASSAGPTESNLMPGDIMLYSRPSTSDGYNSGRDYMVGHVEMYMGDSQRIGHGGPNLGPKTSAYNTDASRYIGAKRYNGFLNQTSSTSTSTTDTTTTSVDATTGAGSGLLMPTVAKIKQTAPVRTGKFRRFVGGASGVDDEDEEETRRRRRRSSSRSSDDDTVISLLRKILKATQSIAENTTDIPTLGTTLTNYCKAQLSTEVSAVESDLAKTANAVNDNAKVNPEDDPALQDLMYTLGEIARG